MCVPFWAGSLTIWFQMIKAPAEALESIETNQQTTVLYTDCIQRRVIFPYLTVHTVPKNYSSNLSFVYMQTFSVCRMASNEPTTAEQESDDLTTCCVCFEVYNEGDRKPKFLSCFHTHCLVCIKVSGLNSIILNHYLNFYSNLKCLCFIDRKWLVTWITLLVPSARLFVFCLEKGLKPCPPMFMCSTIFSSRIR